MGKARPSFDAIDWLLVAAIIGLSAVLLAELLSRRLRLGGIGRGRVCRCASNT